MGTATIPYMGKKSSDSKPVVGRTPAVSAPIQVRFPTPLREQLDILCELHASQLAEEVRIAVRERLERHQLWPPKPRAESK